LALRRPRVPLLSSRPFGARQTRPVPAVTLHRTEKESMAKRARGVRSGQRRPGGRPASRPGQRPATLARGTAPARPGGLTAAEEERAAELEARIVEEERAVDDARRRREQRSRVEAEVARPRGASGGLAVAASEEYAYVVRDVRRIVTIGGGLLIVLFTLFVLIEVAHVVTI
jgi:hypothetical protein